MDIAIPEKAPGKRPAVLWLHGGGWKLGKRHAMMPLVRLTTAFGYVSATPDYRLTSTSVRFPIPVQDAVAALRYLRVNADKYNIDPDRIAIGGESAGGHLAMLVGLIKDKELLGDDPFPGVSTKVSGIIGVYPPTHLPSLRKNAIQVTAAAIKSLMGCELDDNKEKWEAASPVNYLTADAPPTLLVQGDADIVVPFSQAEIYYDKCQEVGAYCELGRVKGAGHGWVAIPASEEYRSTLPLIMHFLARVFPDPLQVEKPSPEPLEEPPAGI